MKFGGTSVGSAERMRMAAQLAAAQKATRPVLIVVSAMSKITDLLLEGMRSAEAGDRDKLEAAVERLRERHVEACLALLPEDRRPEALADIEGIIEEYRRIAGGMLMLSERPPRSVDEAVAVGERLSALLIALYVLVGAAMPTFAQSAPPTQLEDARVFLQPHPYQ